MFELRGSAVFDGVYIRQAGTTELPVYVSNNNAIWVDPKKLAWTGGLYDTYRRQSYSSGRMFSVMSDPSHYCPEKIGHWREFRDSRWTSTDESTIVLECVSSEFHQFFFYISTHLIF